MSSPHDHRLHTREVAAVFDAAAPTYEATGTAYFDLMGQRLVELAQPRPGWRVLDLGTGRGAVLRPARSAVGPTGSVLGVDASPRMAAMTSSELQRPLHIASTATGRGLAAVIVGDAAAPPVTGPFDAVLGGMLAQFLPAPAAALSTWRALMRPQGQLALSWWAGDDDRFSDVDGAVARHLPSGGARTARAFSGDVEATRALVSAAGWQQVSTVVEQLTVSFPSAAAWWAWSWSHGQRRRWESVDDQEGLRRDVDTELVRLSGPDGSITYRPRVAFTLARS